MPKKPEVDVRRSCDDWQSLHKGLGKDAVCDCKELGRERVVQCVKGATEGLGLITLCQDMGADIGTRLNLDATAAKGILERQGISKVRHIDVNVLWLQQQVANKLIPLTKVDGTLNCADLLMKHQVTHVQQRHVEMMQMDFREGRAQMAAQLHSIKRLQPQGEFLEGGACDRWEERGEQGRWVRLHRTPPSSLFNPRKVNNGPGRKTRLGVDTRTCCVFFQFNSSPYTAPSDTIAPRRR